MTDRNPVQSIYDAIQATIRKRLPLGYDEAYNARIMAALQAAYDNPNGTGAIEIRRLYLEFKLDPETGGDMILSEMCFSDMGMLYFPSFNRNPAPSNETVLSEKHYGARVKALNQAPIFITTHRTWIMHDAMSTIIGEQNTCDVSIPAGRYEMLCIDCPLGHDCEWYVIKGTMVGMACAALEQWKDPRNDEFYVEFEGI